MNPNSFPPSLDDFNSACVNGYGAGVVCGHNGDIFVYQSYEIIPEELLKYQIASKKKVAEVLSKMPAQKPARKEIVVETARGKIIF